MQAYQGFRRRRAARRLTGGRCGLRRADLACVRGGREVFAGLGFRWPAARRCWSPGRNGAGKSSLLRMIAGLVRIAGGRLGAGRRRPRADHPRAGPLPRPPGRAEALADGRRKPRILGRAISAATGRRRTAALAAVGLDGAGRPAGRPICRPASGGGCRSPGWSPCSGRSGCSTSRPRRSTATAQDALAGLMRQHLAGGGLIVAAAHGPIGLERRQGAAARETPHERARRAVRARHAARGPRRRRRAASACCSF